MITDVHDRETRVISIKKPGELSDLEILARIAAEFADERGHDNLGPLMEMQENGGYILKREVEPYMPDKKVLGILYRQCLRKQARKK